MRHRSRWLPLLVGSLILTTPAMARQNDAPAAADSVKEAKALLADVAKAYAKAPALTDSMEMTIEVPDQGEQTMSCDIRCGKDQAEITGMLDMLNIYVVDGMVFVSTDMNPNGAIRAELGDKPADAIRKAIGDQFAGFAPPHLGLRFGDAQSPSESLFGFGLVTEPKVTGHQMTENADGDQMHEIMFEGKNSGTVRLHVNPKSKMIMGAMVSGVPEMFGGQGPAFNMGVTFEPKMLARLEKPVSFEASDDMEFYESFDEMMQAGMGDINPSVAVGSEAPGFDLIDQNGKSHSLSGYRGRIVMLDWWGIW